jgi:hypothetical protein
MTEEKTREDIARNIASAVAANDNMPGKSAPRQRIHILPPSLPPRGLSRSQAAEYVGVSPSLFDEMIRDGRMPQPKRVNTRKIWDRKLLDLAFDALPCETNEIAEDWTVGV